MPHEKPSQPSQDKPYEDYPVGQRTRRFHVVEDDGSSSSGWIETGTLVKDGTDHIRVTKPAETPDGSPHSQAFRIKDIPTAKLHEDDERVREELRLPRETMTASAAVARVIEVPLIEEDNSGGVDGRNISRRELWASMQSPETPSTPAAAPTEVPAGMITEVPKHILRPNSTSEAEPERFHY